MNDRLIHIVNIFIWYFATKRP